MSKGFSLSDTPTFSHGVHPDEKKEPTEKLPIERMPFVDEYVVPLTQHIGAPAKALVKPGDKVARGQIIAKPGGFISTAHHAPVTGTVRTIELRSNPNGKLMPSIVIGIDPYSSQRFNSPPLKDPNTLSPKEVSAGIQNAGIVGLGGAAFPSHVKVLVPEGKKVEFVVLNGCECEPYLTCDHRVMLENTSAIVKGLQFIIKQVGAKRGYIGVENNKADAIKALIDEAASDPNIEVVPLQVKYPQGAEKMLIEAILHKEVPAGGKIPLDIDIVVNNVGTAAAITDLFEKGMPLIERVVTVTGEAVTRPKNLMVPLGTPVSAVLEHCGVDFTKLKQLIIGGPMMGMSQKNPDIPVIKGTSGILAFESVPFKKLKEVACIRCGRCLEGCPMYLNPSRLAIIVQAELSEELEEYHILDCFECASCSFTCPSNIPIVQMIRLGKAMLRQKKAS